jgi:hypothetical protein
VIARIHLISLYYRILTRRSLRRVVCPEFITPHDARTPMRIGAIMLSTCHLLPIRIILVPITDPKKSGRTIVLNDYPYDFVMVRADLFRIYNPIVMSYSRAPRVALAHRRACPCLILSMPSAVFAPVLLPHEVCIGSSPPSPCIGMASPSAFSRHTTPSAGVAEQRA